MHAYEQGRRASLILTPRLGVCMCVCVHLCVDGWTRSPSKGKGAKQQQLTKSIYVFET